MITRSGQIGGIHAFHRAWTEISLNLQQKLKKKQRCNQISRGHVNTSIFIYMLANHGQTLSSLVDGMVIPFCISGKSQEFTHFPSEDTLKLPLYFCINRSKIMLRKAHVVGIGF